MLITLDLPDRLELSYSKERIAEDIKLSYALFLYRDGKISISKAAKISGKNIYDFISECNRNKVPVIDYSVEDLKQELENLNLL
ncbi:MAG TPA: UPF0175 family protein [Leptospiraceae bacterium]|nr:UPF0175 family protein [Leptospiraceae bacterium]HNF14820.1 UPF0175 family protein [Leptospiraceae bacterium]HNF26817.1 UPF0175 family protein [Leptospiraceae bacterium]HNI95859.1 UPF0175 family protein [Leptospiraceae bacterium]HNM06080.1 UPF0175 family protein [Leptospiraceae bacterium]